MLHQRIIINEYDNWEVDVYYGVTHFDVYDIMVRLHEIGCDGKFARQAYENLSSGELNTGLTYSSYTKKKSVMVVGVADSVEQFINTLCHEQLHLTAHISKVFYLNMYGEEVCYLMGSIAQKMLVVSKNFICECGCCKENVKKLLYEKEKNRQK